LYHKLFQFGGVFIMFKGVIILPYDVGVSQYLQGKGVSSNDIGYDQNSGNVTVRGQNFYKPELNMAGTTYSNQNNLDNAYNNYSKTLPTIQPTTTAYGASAVAGGIAGAGGNVGQAPKSTDKPASTGYTNPYTQMIGDLIKHLSDSSNAPQQDIYSSPQYAAAQAAQARTSGEAIRQANESAAGAGLGHSTIMTDRSQRIQDDSNNYLQTQLVPQIQAQLEQQRQQEIQNQRGQLNDYMNLANQADSQHNADRTFDAGRQDAATAATGIYNPTGQSVQDVQAKMDANSKAYATATPAEQQRLHTENLQLASQLGEKFDPNSGTYSEGQGFVGTKTIQAKQLDSQLNEVAYNHARDSLLDKRYEAKFNQDIQQQGFDNALKIAVQQHQISNDNAQLAISQQNASNAKANSETSANTAKQNQLMDVWKATGKAPAGITGVTAGTPYATAAKATNYKTDPNFATDIAHLQASPTDAQKLNTNPQPFIDAYGYDGYLALRKAAGLTVTAAQ
jgi:hypothetical protein